jgi:endonuclease/exonuclease/phosphatase family metal-dependent hydrolase
VRRIVGNHDGRNLPAAALRVATWNVRWNGGQKTVAREAELLAATPWDVAMLQEVNLNAWQAFGACGLADGGVSAFDGSFIAPDGKRPHGVALLVRNGLRLTDAVAIAGLPRPGRGVGATLMGWEVPMSVASWHAPNAAASGPAIKMQGYLGFLGWIARQQGPTVAGFDANHWENSTELKLAMPVDPAHGWYLEHRFFGADPPHRLRDAYRDYLDQNPDAYERLLGTPPRNGPLAVTYTRGSKQHPTPDRFDYVFISNELSCTEMDHLYQQGVDAGSDHALVTATLTVHH